MVFLKQSTAITARIGPFLDKTDGDSVEDGLTLDNTVLWIAKAHGAPSAVGQSVTCVALTQGLYSWSVSIADTNTRGPLQWFAHPSGALYCFGEFMVLPANVYDALVGGSDYLDTATAEMATGIISAGIYSADAITSGVLSASAGTEIAAAVWVATTRALTAGALSATIFDTDAITSATLSASAGTELATAVWASTTRRLTAGALSSTIFDTDAITSGVLAASAGTELAAAIWVATTRTLTAGALSASMFDTACIASGAFAANVSPREVIVQAQSLCLAAITGYDPPTKAEMDSGFSALNDVTAAEVWAFDIEGTRTAQTELQWIEAYATGQVSVVGNAYSYMAADQSTTLFTLTASTTMRTVS